MKSA
ncbi:hypothetical protein CAJAP_01321 [Camponotus japonicus]|jgi:ABC-type uncharacterized transport system ATPase component